MTPPHTYSLAPDPELLGRYANRDGVVVAEIAGRDSVAALIAVATDPSREVHAVVPTAVVTGTEYGDANAPLAAVAFLSNRLPEVEFAPLTWVGEPRMWAALNGRFAATLADRLGIFSPCLACHLYMHLCRLPLALALGPVPVVAGERETHDGRIKLSQTATSIDICTDVLGSVGVELLEPLRAASGADVETLVGDGWRPEGAQLECVHSGNYATPDGSVTFDEHAYLAYAEEFLRPAGLALAGALAHGQERPDYLTLVREVLDRSTK